MRDIKGFLIIISMLLLLVIGGQIDTKYKLDGTIIETKNDIAVVEDTAGETYLFYQDPNEFYIGQKVKVWFYNNHTTDNRKDDMVYKVKGI